MEDKMALYVDTKGCAADAQIKTDGNLQYHVGLMMLVLGIDKLNDKTLPDFLARLEFYQRLSAFLREDELATYSQAARDSLGVQINASYEKQATWVKRMATDRFRDIVYAQSRKVEVEGEAVQA
jgi:hypothetical protein